MGSELSGGDLPRPYFFLSYAHTPRNDPTDRDPDIWVEKLYRDLCAHVLQMTTLPAGVRAGFMDRGMYLGEGWAEQLSEALAHCSVFVPLYSRRYFLSEQCGKEWFAFSQRAVHHRTLHDTSIGGIVPALWVPVQPADLPGPAEGLQFNHAEFGTDYATEGFYGLTKLSYLRQEYERAVYRLAQRIVQVAEETSIPQGRAIDYLSAPSAFGPPGPARKLQVTVLACADSDVPEGRGRECYGPTPRDWNPYHPHSARPLADHAADLARNLDYRVSVDLFEDEAERTPVPGPPTAPELLLLDRWALHSPYRRELLKRFGVQNRPWISVLVPWNREDGECKRHEAELTTLTEQALAGDARRNHAGHRSSRGGIPSLDEFANELPVAVQRAAKQYAAYAPTFPPDGPHGGRPRLRGPMRPDHGQGGAPGAERLPRPPGPAHGTSDPDSPEAPDDREP